MLCFVAYAQTRKQTHHISLYQPLTPSVSPAPTSFCNIRISRFLYFKATCFSDKSIIFFFLSVLWKALLNQTDKDDDMGEGCVPSNNRKTRKKTGLAPTRRVWGQKMRMTYSGSAPSQKVLGAAQSNNTNEGKIRKLNSMRQRKYYSLCES